MWDGVDLEPMSCKHNCTEPCTLTFEEMPDSCIIKKRRAEDIKLKKDNKFEVWAENNQILIEKNENKKDIK